MRGKLSDEGLDLVFRNARTHNGFKPIAVAEALLREVYDLAKWGPTSANTSPARFLFIVSEAARGWFEGKPDAETVALRNSALQGAYFMIAARPRA